MTLPDNPAADVGGGGVRERYGAETLWDRLVASYAGLSLPEADLLPWGTWLVLRRDAFLERMRSTEGGRRWLDDAWRLTRTEMDADALRGRLGGV